MQKLSGLTLATYDYRTVHAVASTSKRVYRPPGPRLPARCPCGARLLQKPRHYSSWSTWNTLDAAGTSFERDSINSLFFYPSYLKQIPKKPHLYHSNRLLRSSSAIEDSLVQPATTFHRPRWRRHTLRPPGIQSNHGRLGVAGIWSFTNSPSYPSAHRQSLRSAVTLSEPPSVRRRALSMPLPDFVFTVSLKVVLAQPTCRILPL